MLKYKKKSSGITNEKGEEEKTLSKCFGLLVILFVLTGCSGSRNSQQEVVIEKSANNDKARQFVDQKIRI